MHLLLHQWILAKGYDAISIPFHPSTMPTRSPVSKSGFVCEGNPPTHGHVASGLSSGPRVGTLGWCKNGSGAGSLVKPMFLITATHSKAITKKSINRHAGMISKRTIACLALFFGTPRHRPKAHTLRLSEGS